MTFRVFFKNPHFFVILINVENKEKNTIFETPQFKSFFFIKKF